MGYHKAYVFLFGVILNASQTYGALEINLPQNNVGYYKETTLLNCTDTPFIVANGYSWSKDAVVIYNSVSGDATGTGKYASSHGTGFFTLEIKDTILDDKGDYKCKYNFQEADDALEIHAKGSGQGKVESDKLVITLTEFYPNTTTVSSVICNGKTFTGISTVTVAGELFNLVWTSDIIVDTSDLKNNCQVSMSSISPYVIVIAVDIGSGCPKDCEDRVTASIVLGSLGIIVIALAGVIICIVAKKFNKIYILVAGITSIVLCITSLGLSASVLADDECEDCEDWILDSAIAFVVIPSLLVAAVIAVLIIVFCCLDRDGKCKNGCNGFNCFNGCNCCCNCFNGGNNGGNDGGNNGGNNGGRGHGGGHSGRTDTHWVPTSDRTKKKEKRPLEKLANSEGEVSRKDVHVQEKTGDNFSGRRPMPPIPLTDKKGRGLSANYDDEHPMISVGIPDKKAGDLGPLEEESKKKKKKKKKTKNDGDEREKEENKE